MYTTFTTDCLLFPGDKTRRWSAPALSADQAVSVDADKRQCRDREPRITGLQDKCGDSWELASVDPPSSPGVADLNPVQMPSTVTSNAHAQCSERSPVVEQKPECPSADRLVFIRFCGRTLDQAPGFKRAECTRGEPSAATSDEAPSASSTIALEARGTNASTGSLAIVLEGCRWQCNVAVEDSQ
jgi:hypothetical protein